MKLLPVSLGLLALALQGCDTTPVPYYVHEFALTTDAERKAAADYELQALGALKVSHVGGVANDLEDTLKQIHQQAKELHGSAVMHERVSPGLRTGRWWRVEEFNEAAAKASFRSQYLGEAKR